MLQARLLPHRSGLQLLPLPFRICLKAWMLSHKFVEQSRESDIYIRNQKAKKSWWSLRWFAQYTKDESGPRHFSEEDWEQLNQIIGYKEGDLKKLLTMQDRGNILHTFLKKQKKFDLKLGSYQLSSPNGLLAESATVNDSLVGIFHRSVLMLKWTGVWFQKLLHYLKDPIDQIITFFENIPVSQTIAVETAIAVQMTIDGVKRTAQQCNTSAG
ncbi:hypothetical protein NE237_027787 [Protea cynaroides]|uniref:Uncharacterized protein n=1 Tax=Protea cynaroides TaxID=273540 RepID=A0A9Q0GP21_9MAGN|nr:hypothetical protein NE237_027787 [Protea cynaroides]